MIEPERAAARWELVLPHRPALVRVARSRGLPLDEAEECAQEALLRAVEFAALDETRVLPFLVTTTVRLCVDRGRQHSRDHRLAVKLTGWHAVEASPEDAVCDRAEAEWLAGHLAALPESHQQMLAARADGLDCADVADRFAMSYKAVESQLYRIRTRVRGLLAGTATTVVVLSRRFTSPYRGAVLTSVAAATTVSLLIGTPHHRAPVVPEVPFERSAPVKAIPVAATPAPLPARAPLRPAGVPTPDPRPPSRSPQPEPVPTVSCPIQTETPGMCKAPPNTEYPFYEHVLDCVRYGIDRSRGFECSTPAPNPS